MTVPLLIATIAAFACGAIAIFAVVGSLRSLTRWAFGIALVGFGAEAVFNVWARQAESPTEIAHWQVASLLALSFILGPLGFFASRYARGRTGAAFSSIEIAFAVGTVIVPVIAFLFAADLVALVTMLSDGEPWVIILGNAGVGLHYAMLLTAIFVLINLERTHRASVGTMRWRIKFLVIGMSVLMFVRLYTSSQAILFNSVTPNLNLLNAIGLIVACILMSRTLIRSGHFDIEVYPSQKVLQSSLTIFIVGAYLIAVGVFAKVASYLGGDAAFDIKALGVLIALVLLGILLQSDRFQINLRQFVSRHFKRSLYDYREVWNAFTEATSSKVSQVSLCQAAVESVSKLFDALSVSLWLYDESGGKLQMAATTSNRDAQDRSLAFDDTAKSDLQKRFTPDAGPMNIDRSKEKWLDSIKGATENEFSNGGDRTAIPMTAGDRLVGLIVIGDRVQGIPFADPDLDILGSLGKHAASTLLNVQLSSKILESKELEAFQTMAAFFVHDLKNAASTLNIMVQNLPKHWDSLDFREDALKGISKTGVRVERLIQQLSAVQSELEIDTEIQNFDTFVKQCLDTWETPEQIQLETRFNSDASVSIDAAQLSKVVINLLMNASEAIEGEGRIAVKTTTDGRYARISVEDNGTGISPEFIRKSLFRPFKTTKKSGLGIGMFQSKMIVEAHKGRMEVESEEGKGSKFTIIIPLGEEV